MLNKKVSRRYTLALEELAAKLKLTARLHKDFLLLKKTIEDSRELKIFLKTPIINPQRKSEILHKIFSKKVNPLTLRFINLLCGKNRENILYDIVTDFLNLLNEKSGIAEAKIKTAITLPEKDKKLLVEKLNKYTGKKIVASYSLDKYIKGGFVAQISDTIIDASITRQLELLLTTFKQRSFN